MRTAISIFDLPLGSVGTVVGYNRVYGGYVGKLINKGLLPNTSFIVLDLGTVESGVQIVLENKIITLSKPEANALCVKAINNEET